MIDLSKIKPGDEVTVRGVVHKLGSSGRYSDGDLAIRFQCTAGNAYPGGQHYGPVHGSYIVSHTPKALSVGDRVKPVGFGCALRGELLAVHGDEAWVSFDEGSLAKAERRTWFLSDLERA